MGVLGEVGHGTSNDFLRSENAASTCQSSMYRCNAKLCLHLFPRDADTLELFNEKDGNGVFPRIGQSRNDIWFQATAAAEGLHCCILNFLLFPLPISPLNVSVLFAMQERKY